MKNKDVKDTKSIKKPQEKLSNVKTNTKTNSNQTQKDLNQAEVILSNGNDENIATSKLGVYLDLIETYNNSNLDKFSDKLNESK